MSGSGVVGWQSDVVAIEDESEGEGENGESEEGSLEQFHGMRVAGELFVLCDCLFDEGNGRADRREKIVGKGVPGFEVLRIVVAEPYLAFGVLPG